MVSQSNNIVTVSFKDKQSLYMSYMSFVEGGGLFLPIKRQFNLGDEIFILLKLYAEDKDYTVACKVVWVTPKRAAVNRKQGVGVQFIDKNARIVNEAIKSRLKSKATDSSYNTYTL